MRPKLRVGSLWLALVCVLAFSVGGLSGSEDFMKKLPLYDRYRCAICHEISDPVSGDADLNLFGEAFHANGDKWDATLAELDSDGDGHSNGAEIGDSDGDGIPSADRELSNPGDPLEIPSSCDPKTWGVIKKLFEEGGARPR